MKKNYQYSRKYRQLKYAVKQLKNSNRSNSTFVKSLALKIKHLVYQLKAVMAGYKLKRLLAPILLMLGTALLNPVEAQKFAEPIQNPFDIITIFPSLEFPTFVDLDGDGDYDLFSGNIYSYYYEYNGYVENDEYVSNFYYYENIGTEEEPIYSIPVKNPFGLNGNYYLTYPNFADLDNDGDLDLMSGTDGSLLYFENIGSPTKPDFGKPIIDPFEINSELLDYTFLDLGDLDRDGDFDFLTIASGDVLYFENIGDVGSPQFSEPSLNPFGLDSLDSDLSFPNLVDLDNDGDFDLIIGSSDYDYYENLAYYENIGTKEVPKFLLIDDKFSSIYAGYYMSPAISDLDNDGDFDLLISQYNKAKIFYENIGSNSEPAFEIPVESPFGLLNIEDFERIGGINPKFVDLDADGDYDLAIGCISYNIEDDSNAGKIYYYINEGTPIVPKFSAPSLGPFDDIVLEKIAVPVFVDLDNDDDFDMLIGDYSQNVFYAKNTGTSTNPQFESAEINQFGIVTDDYISVLEAADLDDDQDMDIIVGDEDGNIRYYENVSTDLEIKFSEVRLNPFGFKNADYSAFISIVDIDDDGDLDIFLGTDDYKLLFYENSGSVSQPQFEMPVENHFGFSSLAEYVSPTFADLDSDGDQDLMISSFSIYSGALFYYENVDSIPDTPINILQNQLSNISIYPNPLTDLLCINNFKNIQTIEIFNSFGQLLKQYQNPQQNISLRTLPAATYFAKITDVSGAQAVKKLYKQ